MFKELDKDLESDEELISSKVITFFDSWDDDEEIFTIVAVSTDIIDCGGFSEVNAALYDVEETYFLGGQQRPQLFQRGEEQNGPVQTDLPAQVLPEVSNGAALGGGAARN